MKAYELIVRLLNAIIEAINREKKAEAVSNPADAISNGGSVHKSKESFSDLAEQSKRDRVE